MLLQQNRKALNCFVEKIDSYHEVHKNWKYHTTNYASFSSL